MGVDYLTTQMQLFLGLCIRLRNRNHIADPMITTLKPPCKVKRTALGTVEQLWQNTFIVSRQGSCTGRVICRHPSSSHTKFGQQPLLQQHRMPLFVSSLVPTALSMSIVPGLGLEVRCLKPEDRTFFA